MAPWRTMTNHAAGEGCSRRCWVLGAGAAVLGAWAPHAAAAEALPLAFDAASPPTMYLDEAGRCAGVYPAIVGAALSLMGDNARLEGWPFNRVVQVLQQGRMGAGAVIATPARQQMADFSAPYFQERLRLVVRPSWSGRGISLEALQDQVLGVIRGWSYGQAFDEARQQGRLRCIEFNSDLAGLMALKRYRIDAMVCTEPAALVWLRWPALSSLWMAEGELLSFGMHVAFRKGLAQQDWLRRFDEAVAQLRGSGRLDQVVAAALQQATLHMHERLVGPP